jgi:hypothetical protein
MKKIEFFHQNPESNHYARCTTALELPNKQQLIDLLSNSNELQINMGTTFVHPKENYVKAIGRDRAIKAMSVTTCSVVNIKPQPDGKWMFHFCCVVPNTRPKSPAYSYTEFAVSIVANSTRVRLEYVIVN